MENPKAVCCYSVTKLCPTLCDPMDCTTPGFPVLYHLQSLLKLMSIELVMPSDHLILCHPLLLPPSISPSIRVFSSESAVCIRWPKYRSFSFSISPSNESVLRIRWPKYWCFYYGSNRSETLCPLYTCCKCLLSHPSSGQN